MIIADKKQYTELMQNLVKETGVIAMDTEVSGFNPKNPDMNKVRLDGIGIYSENHKAYISVELLGVDFEQLLQTKEIIFHNAKFDITVLEYHGFDISNLKFHDTMLMAWLSNENRHSFGLKQLAQSILKVKEDKITKYTDISKKPLQEQFQDSQDYQTALFNWVKEMGEYCIKDCEYTYKLFQHFKPKLEEDKLWYIYESLEIPFCEVLRNMENRGIMIDIPYLKKMNEAIDSKMIQIKAEIYKQVGRVIDINSPKQLREYFIDELKIDLPGEYKTPKGEVSMNVSAMQYIAEELNLDIAKQILAYREMTKLNSTYVKGMMEIAIENIVHTSFNQTSTVTGRISSSNPNLMNIPRRDDEFNIRQAFKAREGYTFIIADYSQIELRLMAWFSKDPEMQKIYQQNGDIHQKTADTLGCTRQIAKSLNFGLNYGRTAYGMAKGLGISSIEAQAFIDKYFQQYKGVAEFMEKCKQTIQTEYAVKTITKRKRRFPEYPAAKQKKDTTTMKRLERQATNARIQGSASDVIKIAMRNIFKKIKPMGGHILIQIHDELVIEVPKEKAEEMKEIVKYEMEHAVDLKTVPLVTEPHISEVWTK